MDSSLLNLRRLCFAASLGLPLASAAQGAPPSEPGPWTYSAAAYTYLPSIGGSTSFPVDASGATLDVSARQIIERLKMTFMGSFEAHNGRWGVGTDLVYTDLGSSKTNTRDFSIGGRDIPASTTANLDWDYKATIWTLVAEYRLLNDAATTVDLLAGARMLDQRQRLRWQISGNLGPISPAARAGGSELSQTVWDGIVGIKGRHLFGAERAWTLPFYLDVGTGQSDSTVQAALGIGYRFSWGELAALWRYLGYHPKSGSAIESMNFSGPQLGLVFRW